MKYRAKHLKFNGKFWTCILERWEGCECSKETINVEINQTKKPSLLEIKKAAIW